MSNTHITPTKLADALITQASAFRTSSMGLLMAARAVVEMIECDCLETTAADHGRWYDTRAMLDPREHPGPHIDMATQTLDYGLDTGLLHRHATQPYLVRITPFGKPASA